MYALFLSVIACAVVVSANQYNDYGTISHYPGHHSNNRYSTSDSSDSSENELKSRSNSDERYPEYPGVYAPQPPATNYGTNGNEYRPPNNVYEQNEYEQCKEIKHFSVHKHRTARADIKTVERKGKTYNIIACPNSGKPYALVAKKEGTDASFKFETEFVIQDTILLASGYNFDYVAKCDDKNFVGKSFNDREVAIRKVTCVELPGPRPLTGF